MLSFGWKNVVNRPSESDLCGWVKIFSDFSFGDYRISFFLWTIFNVFI